MQLYRKSSHSVYDIKYHVVWIIKYRKPVLRGEIAERVRELIQEICKSEDVEIIIGDISREHVHIFVLVPPHVVVSKLVQSLKGKTSRKMLSEFRRPNRTFWGRHFWRRSYFVASSGNSTDEVIIRYSEEQGKTLTDGEFKIDN